MSAFTVFFCGTGSNSFDFASLNYFKGELISTLARNHGGQEFVDWIICDGPGSGTSGSILGKYEPGEKKWRHGYQEGEKWVASGRHGNMAGAMSGAGWEENVQHAVAVLRGFPKNTGRSRHTRAETKLLRKMGVGVDEVERGSRLGRAVLGRKKTVHHTLHARITPQALQEARVRILRKNKTIDRVNAIGWSRGGITCHMFANALAKDDELSHLPVNIFACDPVAGGGGGPFTAYKDHRTNLGANVENYVGVYAQDERSQAFSPVLPGRHTNTRSFIITMPGRHGTLVGNASRDGSEGIDTVFAPGKVTRDLAEKYLTLWGTPLTHRHKFGDIQILKLYDEMMGNRETFIGMRTNTYISALGHDYLQDWDTRTVNCGSGTWSTMDSERPLQPDPLFINLHHRALLSTAHPDIYALQSGGRTLPAARLDTALLNLGTQYPNLSTHWVRSGVLG